MFSYVSAEKRVPQDHPLRRVRAMVDAALKEMSPQFGALYSRYGRPSIAPEKLLRALLLQLLYCVRSERLLMEQLEYNLLFRWFVGLKMDDEVWDVTVFTKNRERLLEGEIAGTFFAQVLEQAQRQGLLSDEHFTVDGTLIEAWANRRSFHEKKDPPQRGSGYGGKKLLRDTHESGTDPEARLYKRSRGGRSEAELSGACADRESERADREGLRDGVQHASGAGSGAGDAAGNVAEGRKREGEADHAGRGQGVPGGSVHWRTADDASDPAHRRV